MVLAQLHRRVLISFAVGLVCLGGLALAAHPTKPFGGRGVTATGTIMGTWANGDERAAGVRFQTASGVGTGANIAICHHQSYAVGNSIEIVYDAANPSRALEKDMIAAPLGVAPVFVMEMVAGLVLLAAARGRRRRVAPIAPFGPVPRPVEATAEVVTDAELASFLADAASRPELVDA